MFTVAGKTSIITGAGSGINMEFATILLERGSNVVIADLCLRPEAEEVVEKYNGQAGGPKALFLKRDVTSWQALESTFNETLRYFGDFHLVCPGAGVYEPNWSSFWHPPGSSSSTDAHPRGDPAHGIPAKVSPSNPKRIIHISSVAGQLPNFNAPLYSASKFGITGFVRSLEPLDAMHGIRVSAVAPGLVQTPLWTEDQDKIHFIDPTKDRWIVPRAVAEAMLRCAEDDSLGSGTILEVGRNCTRVVGVFNDPGPDSSGTKGLRAANAKEKGRKLIGQWLDNSKIWGC